LWWLVDDAAFRASGIFGQRIYVNPEAGVVIAQHAAREAASSLDDWALQAAMEAAVTGELLTASRGSTFR
jgi:CubicO group peptidase (beta-lactamase class C family)